MEGMERLDGMESKKNKNKSQNFILINTSIESGLPIDDMKSLNIEETHNNISK